MELLKYNNTVIALINTYPDEILVEMGESNINWNGVDTQSFLTVIARNTNVGLMSTPIGLEIRGNALFTATNNKKITLITSNTSPLTVPITINGCGTITVFPYLIIERENK